MFTFFMAISIVQRSFCFQRYYRDDVNAIIHIVDRRNYCFLVHFVTFRFVLFFLFIFSFVEEILKKDLTDENCHMIIICLFPGKIT